MSGVFDLSLLWYDLIISSYRAPGSFASLRFSLITIQAITTMHSTADAIIEQFIIVTKPV